MTPSNEICPICSYAGSAQYCSWPTDEQRRTGVVPLDSLPAAWWNGMWADTTNRINEARDMVGQLITEVNNVLNGAGINPQAACTDQLYQSINKIRQTLATASVPGAVVSSSCASEVAVDPATGVMSVNCLGNATALTTSAHTVVGAINELKSTYDCCISDIEACNTALGDGKAPNMHASDQTTYGVGNAACYGHVKISDTYTCVLTDCEGVAASQCALATAYMNLLACAGAPLGNTAGCALGTASAGSAGTAARSDHVHPMPSSVCCAAHLLINGATWDSNWHWNGQGGQPTWLWGSNDGSNMYVWNPSNFSVNYANSAGSATRTYYLYNHGAQTWMYLAFEATYQELGNMFCQWDNCPLAVLHYA